MSVTGSLGPQGLQGSPGTQGPQGEHGGCTIVPRLVDFRGL